MENNFCDISVDDFVELFRNAQVMHSTKVKILKTHFQCTEHTATARQLSELLGYKNFNAVNLQYGLFVKSLALEFGISKINRILIGFSSLWILFINQMKNVS